MRAQISFLSLCFCSVCLFYTHTHTLVRRPESTRICLPQICNSSSIHYSVTISHHLNTTWQSICNNHCQLHALLPFHFDYYKLLNMLTDLSLHATPNKLDSGQLLQYHTSEVIKWISNKKQVLHKASLCFDALHCYDLAHSIFSNQKYIPSLF